MVCASPEAVPLEGEAPEPLELGLGPQPPAKEIRTVLVVDDEPDIRLMLRYLLEFDGYKVVEASNGEEALDLLANEPVSILITDVCMPSMDGLELLKHLRDGRAIVPHIIAMSGFLHFAPIAEAAAASLAEVDFVLDKPFSRVDLLKALSHTDPKGSSNELT